MAICEHVESALAQATEQFKRDTTNLIHKRNNSACFQLRLDGRHAFFTHPVHKTGQCHAASCGALHPVKTAEDDSATAFFDTQIAIAGAQQLLNPPDLELPQCLGVNRDKLVDIFVSRHQSCSNE